MLTTLTLPALYDNYIWLLMHPVKRTAIIVDPGASDIVLTTLDHHKLKLTAIIITHHHYDHTQGIAAILNQHPVPVLGPKTPNIPQITEPLNEETTIKLPGLSLNCQIIKTPGHTQDHLSYYTENGCLFTGDTLFTAGCGRLFEGSAAQMYNSLSKLLRLPNSTQLYCGHEYTEQNLAFAHYIEPHNHQITARLKQVKILRQSKKPTVPSDLQQEKQTNPFLRCHTTAIRAAAEKYADRSLTHPAKVLGVIRAWKDEWTG